MSFRPPTLRWYAYLINWVMSIAARYCGKPGTKSLKATLRIVLGASVVAMSVSLPLGGQDLRTVSPRGATKDAVLNSVPTELRPAPCKPPTYWTVPPPDEIAQLLSERKRYRLVIGASKVRDQSQSQEYVEETAKLVDEQLASLGYAPLPGLKRPYLVGEDANHDAVENAVREMADLARPQDIGIIYYIGHGTLTPKHDDLTLAVSDRPLGETEGIRAGDLIGWLALREGPSNVLEIPHYIIILDSCYSGNIASGPLSELSSNNGNQTIKGNPEQFTTTNRIAILTATAQGDNTLSSKLGRTQLSAFGYYLTEALDSDWTCADSLMPDGILTLDELQLYLDDKLAIARKAGAIGEMHPQIPRDDRRNMFMEYRSDRVSIVDGLVRRRVVTLYAIPPKQTTAELKMPSGLKYSCSLSQPEGCSIPFSKNYPGELRVVAYSTRSPTDFWAFWRPVIEFIRGLLNQQSEDKKRTPGPSVGDSTGGGPHQSPTNPTSTNSKSGSIKLSTLVKRRRAKVAGVLLEIK